ncbi:N-acetylneuraminate synthase family protein [Clostridium sporogenes]|uniref:N-acetylneuraminate synthase family protein n=1 Tax=Clostridium sporogenes TaxID=1509 RepID=UPI00024BA091|nr:N-acetylneuraminate synthase family protein [Clostridium sporogenes]EHN13945.1 spore coat polysaccharide biosynthesis protein SpsE [Clostridium sporogenes PA 3679]KYN77479.1 hypothetical protein A0J52_11580 [Clostridium sporogenes]MCW6107412.1 N-acetylneuraminate synthase family protein [Clostridium sporogenes]MDU4598203.1 N-acetylneuraminate synthase family protein [Clostridium sporogenes]NFF67588.1 hypothetical protein [Clostridium sporogenes]
MLNINIRNKIIGDKEPCFIIAELGSNHDGKIEQAKQLIEVASEAGVDAVKLQIPIADECYPPNTKFGGIYGDTDISSIIRTNQIPFEWIPELVKYGHERGLVVGASADGFIGLSMMLKGNVDFVKIPSFTISHIPLLKEAKKTNIPWLLSTGVHSLSEVEEAIQTVDEVPVAIFHCISSYPAPLDELNLINIPFLKDYFDIPVGFSDHSTNPTLGSEIAVALGANMIEKHFTLDRNLKGPDHSFALEPNELKQMVNHIRKVENDLEYKNKVINESNNKQLFGDIRRGVINAEKDFKKRTRLGIYFLRQLRKGSVISYEDVRVFRCANTEPEIHPRFMELIIGTKVVKDCNAFEPVTWNHILNREDV